MLYTFLDIETSGFSAHTDGLLQFAALQCDENMAPIRGISHYVYEPNRHWSTDAEQVHGLSRAYMERVAEPLEQVVPSMYAMLQYGTLVGFNNIQFDTPFLSHWLQRQGCPILLPHTQYDVMKMWEQELGTRHKLTYLQQYIGFPPQALEIVTNTLFNGANPRPHDACYDVIVTFLLFKEIKRRHTVAAKAAPPPPDPADYSDF